MPVTDNLEIRESLPEDMAAIEALYPDAFPEENLLPLVRDLVKEKSGVLSLVGMIGASLAGHVVFTRCSVEPTGEQAALLGPLAVASAQQRQGIGGALVRAGLEREASAGAANVYVLGDPAYYGRFGFSPDDQVAAPYPLPNEWKDAWQSVSLRSATPAIQGTLSVPQPWRQPAYWGA